MSRISDVRASLATPSWGNSLAAWTRDEMAARAAQKLRDRFYASLGIGSPTLVANDVPPGV